MFAVTLDRRDADLVGRSGLREEEGGSLHIENSVAGHCEGLRDARIGAPSSSAWGRCVLRAVRTHDQVGIASPNTNPHWPLRQRMLGDA